MAVIRIDQQDSMERYRRTGAVCTKKAPFLVSKKRGIILATTYSRTSYTSTTIGAMAFHFRVRDGNGWGHHARITRRAARTRTAISNDTSFISIKEPKGSLTTAHKGKILQTSLTEKMLRIKSRTSISIAELNTLLRLYPRPINVVVYHDSSGRVHLGRGLALRCFQRLSFPNIATQQCS